MKDSWQGGILATILIAPVMIVCCGGGAAVLTSVLAGLFGALSGMTILTAVVMAMMAYLVVAHFRRSCRAPETQPHEETG